jgi:molybdopterin-guanine dinucleotide biosynthesis protein A
MNITGLILAGGRGMRMGAVDKGLQPFRGMTMVEHAIARLAPQVDGLMVNANQNIDIYAGFGVPVWPDVRPDYAGPLAGIEAGLRHCPTPYLMTVPCDSPFLPQDLVARLANALLEQDAEIAIPVTGIGAQRQSQPVFALLKVTLLEELATFLQNDGHKMMAWFASHKLVEVFFEDEAAFRNINTLAELQRFEH